jgi:asparagine synthase (glutamine-hydrolysing)
MRDTLLHRGPDGAGLHVEPGLGLGHRRLSIVDVQHGQQPMLSESGRFVLVYNGEIFNHPDLKASLERDGVRYRTRSDTETVLHLYEIHGAEAVRHLRGMFAFAVWDKADRSLLLARDRFGIKPLYYMQLPDGSLAFGSEIKAIASWSGRSCELNVRAMPDFLANHAPSGSETLFKEVRRLPPGTTLLWRDGKIQLTEYWTGDMPATCSVRSKSRATDERVVVDEFGGRLKEAIKIRLMSDVPLGMFLSGGIDSAAITATMADLVTEPIKTFSVAFSEREANELSFARLVSKRYQTDHHEITISPSEFFQNLPKLIWHEDEPIAHPSSVALNFVSRLAAQHVKVVLTGEGSDELLAGYNRYRVTKLNVSLGTAYASVMPRALQNVIASLASPDSSSRLSRKLSRTFLRRGASLDKVYFDNFAVFDREMQRDLMSETFLASTDGVDPYEAYHLALSRVPDATLLSRLLYVDRRTYLHELLMKQDQMSMAASIESRVPFLDHQLAEWLSSIPDHFKLRGMTTKWILREAMKNRLPKEILTRSKMGFPVPFGSWIRGEWVWLMDEFVTGARPLSRGYFRPEAVRALVKQHMAGVNHSERLWSLLNFEIWCRMAVDGSAPWEIRPIRREYVS